jgi:hypothetical protein
MNEGYRLAVTLGDDFLDFADMLFFLFWVGGVRKNSYSFVVILGYSMACGADCLSG